MVLLGTIFNTITVAIGSSLGLLSGRRINAKVQTNIIIVFGLFTLAMSFSMIQDMHQPINIFLALVIGALLGDFLQLHSRFEKFASRFDSKDSESFGGAFIKATMLFCVGGMTLVGCMNEGIDGDYNLIMVKSVMDLISSFFLASALGRGVLFSALGILGIQGSLTLGFHFIGVMLSPELIIDLTATGGILLLALGLDLVGIKKFKMFDLIPALLILPLVHIIHNMIF